jgi:hypothetical protein
MMKYTPRGAQHQRADQQCGCGALAASASGKVSQTLAGSAAAGQRVRVGGDPKVGGGLADESGVADQQVERQRENRKDHDLGDEPDRIFRDRRKQQQQNGGDDQPRQKAALHADPAVGGATALTHGRTIPADGTAARPPSTVDGDVA